MNICHITHNYPRYPGDHAGFFIEDLTKGLVKQLKGKSKSIAVIAPHQTGLHLYQDCHGIDVYRVRYGVREQIAYTGKMHHYLMNPIYWIQFLNLFKKTYQKIQEISEHYDILHFHWIVPSGVIGYFIQHPCKIISIHGTDLRIMKKYPWNLVLKKILSRYNLVLPVSSYLEKILKGHTSNLNTKVLPIIGNLDHFLHFPSSRISRPLKMITVSRISRQKNLTVVLKAIKLLSDSNIPINYTIVGDGEYKHDLIALAERMGIAPLVKFTGMVRHDRVPELLKNYDIFVLPSLDEGFGLSILEARLSGKLVIGSNSGGITDLINDQSTGIIIDPHNPFQLAETIKSLVNEQDKFHEITIQSFNQAKEKYSYSNQIKQWVRTYSEIAHNSDF